MIRQKLTGMVSYYDHQDYFQKQGAESQVDKKAALVEIGDIRDVKISPEDMHRQSRTERGDRNIGKFFKHRTANSHNSRI
jgi:hypothetical protein